MDQKDDGTTAVKILQIVYQLVLIPLVGFIAIQTYQINASQKAMNERIAHLEEHQVNEKGRVDNLVTNQALICAYEEPAWPTHARCVR